MTPRTLLRLEIVETRAEYPEGLGSPVAEYRMSRWASEDSLMLAMHFRRLAEMFEHQLPMGRVEFEDGKP